MKLSSEFARKLHWTCLRVPIIPSVACCVGDAGGRTGPTNSCGRNELRRYGSRKRLASTLQPCGLVRKLSKDHGSEQQEVKHQTHRKECNLREHKLYAEGAFLLYHEPLTFSQVRSARGTKRLGGCGRPPEPTPRCDVPKSQGNPSDAEPTLTVPRTRWSQKGTLSAPTKYSILAPTHARLVRQRPRNAAYQSLWRRSTANGLPRPRPTRTCADPHRSPLR